MWFSPLAPGSLEWCACQARSLASESIMHLNDESKAHSSKKSKVKANICLSSTSNSPPSPPCYRIRVRTTAYSISCEVVLHNR
ncbi:hypothetical protein P692DRAFT_20211777 [Suillus brevipes Sb2]|nr:hypothetical protein P692DRAFT_20211777 [Suillus brevipes Sb2]